MRLCTLCESKHLAKGYCIRHYSSQVNSKSTAYKLSQKTYRDRKGREWNTERVRAYRLTKEGKLAIKRAIKKYEATHPDRKKAWTKAKVIPLEVCMKCGATPTHRHHPDPLKPLDVISLCPLHHKQQHMI